MNDFNDLDEAFEEIMRYAHFWNWGPDWQVTKEVYKTFPKSYSVLTPFAYSYLEELIRSTTSEYGMELFDEHRKPRSRKVGLKLIDLAIVENTQKQPEFVVLLKDIKIYYNKSQVSDKGDNRHSVAHGYMHPRWWNQESFEKLIFDIARLSKFARF